jgi:hypothetical protein
MPSESPDKGEESGSKSPATTDRFKSLTKRLLAVKPKELAEQEQAYRRAKKNQRNT